MNSLKAVRPISRIPLQARGLLLLLASMVLLGVLALPAHASFGLQSGSFENTLINEDGSPAVQAGSHPFAMVTAFAFNRKSGNVVPDGDPRNIEVALPAGLVGDPTTTPKCTIRQFNTPTPGTLSGASCPNDSQVGVAQTEIDTNRLGMPLPYTFGIYNLVPPPGVPAEFGFNPLEIPVVLTPRVRTGGDYGVTTASINTSQLLRIYGVKTTLWGVPAASSHDGLRGACLGLFGAANVEGKSCPVETPRRPFLRLPTSCPTGPLATAIHMDSWQEPVSPLLLESEASPVYEVAFNHDGEGRPVGVTGCGRLDFSPTVDVQPDTEAASSPTGLSVEVQSPQNDNPDGLAEADLRTAKVSLPAGMSVSPSSANGLQACTEAEIGMSSAGPVSCPDASKVGTVEVQTPLLEAPLTGSVYVAQPYENKFHSLLALYIVAEGSGVLVKLAGEVHADPATGQLTTTFDNNPQTPFSHLKLSFFGGPRAALMTPSTCGSYSVTGAFTPWSTPVPVVFSEPFEVKTGCGGGFSPSFSAGTVSNQAGGFSPFGLLLSRSDQDQDFGQLSVRTAPGLLGMLSKVQLCEEPQAALGTCPQASKIGHVTVGAGPGPSPVFVPQPGKPQDPVYLTGPYKGAPFGLSVVVPAEAGPFNLGTVVVRSAIHVDPHTSQITIVSDPLPTILKGIPLHVRTINVLIDREGFTFNPTNCSPLSLDATVGSDQGATALLSSRFQAVNCASLKFAPKFTVSTSGRTSKANGSSLDTKLSFPAGSMGSQANISYVKVDLPKQLPSRLTTLQKACPAAQFAANPAGCPAASVVGTVRASTPVLPVQLTGPVYFVSHGGEAFPDLEVVLQGEGVRVDLTGTTFINKAGITSTTFKTVPDVPVSSFELKLPQGRYSVLGANLPTKAKGSFCGQKLTMPTLFVAQNGAQLKQTTKIAVTGCPRASKAKRAKRARRG
jgi:hypothetical protein